MKIEIDLEWATTSSTHCKSTPIPKISSGNLSLKFQKLGFSLHRWNFILNSNTESQIPANPPANTIQSLLLLTNTSAIFPHFMHYLFNSSLNSGTMELQADLLVGISIEQHQNKENSPPFLSGRSALYFSNLHLLKRCPLQDITHLFSSNTTHQSIHNGRRMISTVETRARVETMAVVQNRKRKSTGFSSESNPSDPNLKRRLLRRDFR